LCDRKRGDDQSGTDNAGINIFHEFRLLAAILQCRELYRGVAAGRHPSAGMTALSDQAIGPMGLSCSCWRSDISAPSATCPDHSRKSRCLWHACRSLRFRHFATITEDTMKKAPPRPRVRRALLIPLLTTVTTIAMAKTSLLYIATQDPAKMGIAVAEFDPDTGALSAPRMAVETRDPAHIVLSADHKHLYVCNTGTPGGVSAFEIDPKTAALKLLNYKESKGRGPSYVSIDRSGRYVLDANYGGGYVEIYSLTKDGSLDRQTAFVQHEGSSVHPQRQTKPYAHWFHTDPSNKFGLVADLGTDQIVVYKFDASTGRLGPDNPPAAKVAGGLGPRHLAFHPNGRWVYATAEMGNEVMAFGWDANNGTLTQFQSVKTLAPEFTGPSTAAEIAVRADGRFLYASNRGEDSIVVYAVDAHSGALSFTQRVPSRGKVPRFFTFDPTNKWLIVSNQEGASVSVFSVDARTGGLAPIGAPIPVMKPMAVAFLR
jgi:6-phosphogluconolactonase